MCASPGCAGRRARPCIVCLTSTSRRTITRARATGYTVRAEKILETVNTATDPQKARLQFDAERWFLGKMCPKKFGDATMIKHADADGERIELDPVARVTRLAGIFQQIEARKEGDEGE